MSEYGVTLSYLVRAPKGCEAIISLSTAGCEAIIPLSTADGALYNAYYRYERRGHEWWAVLTRIEEIMPPATPQTRRLDDQARCHMMAQDGSLDFEAEAAQRRKEWADLNAQELGARR